MPSAQQHLLQADLLEISNENVTASIIPLLGPSLVPNTIYDFNYTTTAIAGYNGRTLPYARGRMLGGSSSVSMSLPQYILGIFH